MGAAIDAAGCEPGSNVCSPTWQTQGVSGGAGVTSILINLTQGETLDVSLYPREPGVQVGDVRIVKVSWTATLQRVSRTFIICKPDAVERGYVGEILARFERKGLKLVAGELRTLDADTLAKHYAEHVGKGFYDELVAFMSRSPAFVAVLEGPDDTYAIVRTMMGPTNPAEAPPGTIRGDFGTVMTENLVHGSDSNESAEREIAIFFPGL